ncbi:conserved membrane hypothetical protein [Planktothrix sp. PCC 11201]|uniref:DUF2232 domain-containing protein n=1 Tax=Planktothrix sp. PCC 11201 TaxID=1729650 RepID=UPI000913F36A|nr:DUF2232 domain-containing protein [Planktothrix sp. PCC 11201]SKB14464.1 conserved membrane hypothetical protein [Planktothrix sp. PCC 11201]
MSDPSPLSSSVNPRESETQEWVSVDADIPGSEPSDHLAKLSASHRNSLILVETAFLASAASLIWFVNYYFPMGPVLRLFFALPMALLYLRWGKRAAVMGAVASFLLLSVLMGPTRSIVFLIPYGWLGVVLGGMWKRKSPWWMSIGTGSLIVAIGFFFKYWLLSILLGRNLWAYATIQITAVADWIFIKLGILAQPSLMLVQVLAVLMILINSIVYLFVVHLVSLLLLDRLNSPIPRPPKWVQILLDYDV